MADRLRIGIVYDDVLDRPGGVGSYCRDLARELARLGHYPEFLVGSSSATEIDGFPVHALSRNVTVAFNGNVCSVPAVARRRQIRALLADREYDVLHVQMPYSPFMAGLVIDEASPAATVVGTFHVFSESPLVRFGTRLLAVCTRRTTRRIERVFAVSQPAETFARDYMAIETTILPNMVDTSRISHLLRVSGSDRRPSPKSGPSVVFVGNLVKRKGVAHLIDAFAILLATAPTASLTVAGAGPELRALKQQVDRLRITDSVRFVGRVPDHRKFELLRGADVACFPSLYGESFGIVVLEAIAAGASAVVTGRNAGYASTLAGLEPDVCVDAAKPPVLAAALARAIISSDQGLRDRLSAIASAHDVRGVTAKIVDEYWSARAVRDEGASRALSGLRGV